jgi:uncharacterized membrane protein
VFLLIESRRYSLFAFSRNRVLMLERGFYGRSLLRDVRSANTPLHDMWPMNSSWELCLKDMLLKPLPHVEVVSWGSFYIRLTRHYVFLFLAVTVGWVFKVLYSDVQYMYTLLLSVLGVIVVLSAVVAYFRPADGGFGFLASGIDNGE